MTDTQVSTAPVGKDISHEQWREYNFTGRDSSYLISEPKLLFVGETTHRVVDRYGVVHCAPAPGRFGCVVSWKPRDTNFPVQF